MRDYFGRDRKIWFEFPLDGDCLNCYDGDENGDILSIITRVTAAPGLEVFVNGERAEWDGAHYLCPVVLVGYRTVLEAVAGGEKASVTVFKLRDSVGRYRLSSDDNILFLKDINDHKDIYSSIFDNPYLAVYKKAHDLYDTCVHINIYYEYGAEEAADFAEHKEFFNLSMMTDRFKSEWQKNAHWLKLSFHARKNYPNAPYKNATAEEVIHDIEAVHREIIRFAGEETLSPVTTLHFGASNLEVTRALRSCGYRGLAGYFEVTPKGDTLVAYHYPVDLVRYVGNRDFWVDTQEDIVFGRIDCVLNLPHDPAQNIEVLEEVMKNKHRAGFISILMHEEYFYSDYRNRRERFEELVLEACRWCYEHGYRGALMEEVMFEVDDD